MKSKHKESFVSSASQIELLQLSYFIAVAENESFSKAAESIYVTQPLLSQHISALERLLDAKLFERNTKSIKLTEFGEYFYRKAKEIVSKTNDTIETVRSANKQPAGTSVLVIGIDNYLDRSILIEPLKKLTAKYPYLEIEIKRGVFPDILHSLKQGICQLGLSFSLQDTEPSELSYKNLFIDHLELIGSEIYQSCADIKEFARKVERKPLLLPRRETKMVPVASALCEKLGLQKRTLFFDNVDDMRFAIETDEGFTFIPKTLLDHNIGGRITRFEISSHKESEITYQIFWADPNPDAYASYLIEHI